MPVINSAYGLIKSNYNTTQNQFTWNITIPANTTAMIYIPADHKNEITEKIAINKGFKIY